MPAYPRAELEEMVERWLEVNRQGEAKRDWHHMADMYTEDATYGWNVGPNDEFMVVGREQIREVALGSRWPASRAGPTRTRRCSSTRLRARSSDCGSRWPNATRADGTNYEIAGLGGSWFRYAGNFLWSWQRDFFDVGNAGALFMQMIRDGTLLPGMQQRMERAMSGERLPGPLRAWARHRSACGRCPKGRRAGRLGPSARATSWRRSAPSGPGASGRGPSGSVVYCRGRPGLVQVTTRASTRLTSTTRIASAARFVHGCERKRA